MKIARVLITFVEFIFRLFRGLRRRIRNYYYKLAFKKMGKSCQICDEVLITGADAIALGDNVVINDRAIIQSCEGAEIFLGSCVTISYGAQLLTGGLHIGEHHLPGRSHRVQSICVNEGVWIGAGAIILPGVTIGASSVIAAGCVVTESVPDAVVVGGVPGRIIARIDNDQIGVNNG